jgi:hypothetical protein
MVQIFQSGVSLLAKMTFIDRTFRVPGYSQNTIALQAHPDSAPGLAEAADGLYYSFHIVYDSKIIGSRKQKGGCQ